MQFLNYVQNYFFTGAVIIQLPKKNAFVGFLLNGCKMNLVVRDSTNCEINYIVYKSQCISSYIISLN